MLESQTVQQIPILKDNSPKRAVSLSSRTPLRLINRSSASNTLKTWLSKIAMTRAPKSIKEHKIKLKKNLEFKIKFKFKSQEMSIIFIKSRKPKEEIRRNFNSKLKKLIRVKKIFLRRHFKNN
jgi:hypothetical protein